MLGAEIFSKDSYLRFQSLQDITPVSCQRSKSGGLGRAGIETGPPKSSSTACVANRYVFIVYEPFASLTGIPAFRAFGSQVARYTASRPEKKATLDVLEGNFLKLLEGAKPTSEVRLADLAH